MRVLNTRTLCAVKEWRYQMHLKYVRNRLKEKLGQRPTRDLRVGIPRVSTPVMRSSLVWNAGVRLRVEVRAGARNGRGGLGRTRIIGRTKAENLPLLPLLALGRSQIACSTKNSVPTTILLQSWKSMPEGWLRCSPYFFFDPRPSSPLSTQDSWCHDHFDKYRRRAMSPPHT